jgi:hypothetical protein
MFLAARMPAGQQPVADEAEQFEPVWVRPTDALARHEAGQFFLIFPTIRTLERLRNTRTSTRAGRLRRRAAAVEQLPACRPAARRRGALHGARDAVRRARHDLPRWPVAARAGLEHGAAGAAAEEPHAPDRLQPRRDDRPRHQQLPGGRPGHRLHRDRPGAERARTPGAPVARRGRRHPVDRVHPFAPGPLARRAAAAGAVRAAAADPGPAFGADRPPGQRVHARSHAARWRSAVRGGRRRAPQPAGDPHPRPCGEPPVPAAAGRRACSCPATTS